MKNVGALRAAGFTVMRALDAVGCTLVTSPHEFAYYNPRDRRTPAEIFQGLTLAPNNMGLGFRGLFAGEFFEDSDDIPYEIISSAEHQRIVHFHRRYEEALVEASYPL